MTERLALSRPGSAGSARSSLPLFITQPGNAPSRVDHVPLFDEIEPRIDCLVDPDRPDARYRRRLPAHDDLLGLVPVFDIQAVRRALGRHDAHSRKKLRFRANANLVLDKEVRACDESELFDVGAAIRIDPDVAHLRQGEARFHKRCIFLMKRGSAVFGGIRRARKAAYGRSLRLGNWTDPNLLFREREQVVGSWE
ncbi:hypothetical protein [Burkholderia latens]|uniref:hypothetical protein n=1 Tax=Burkholderia latens TaxID=488446 RepID=UPI0015825D19|nr:hypothetical protein [Burkholderia latens]